MCVISSTAWTAENDFEYFDTYLKIHERQMKAGKWLLFTGLPLAFTGSILVSGGMTVDNIDTIEQDVVFGLTTSGYTFLGVGLLLVSIGFPLWIFGTNEYYYILERRERYFLMIQQ